MFANGRGLDWWAGYRHQGKGTSLFEMGEDHVHQKPVPHTTGDTQLRSRMMDDTTKANLKQYVNDIKEFCMEVNEAIDDDNPEDALSALQRIVDFAELLINDIDI